MRSIFQASLFIGFLSIGLNGFADPCSGSRTATILAINDVYQIGGLNGGALGGLPRLRTLRKQLEREAPDLLLLHAGDFLFPSVLSRRYQGAQIIDLMNRLDGDPQAFDARMFVTFGNHEFDRSRREDAALLQQRIAESQFRWLGTNVHFDRDPSGKPLIAAKQLEKTALVESGGMRIGLFSLTTERKHPQYVSEFSDPLETAWHYSEALRQQGAEVVIALTHLRARRDRAILETLEEEGPDLIVGGHEHDRQIHRASGHRLVIKADADARTAGQVRIQLDCQGKIRIQPQFITLDASIPPDPDLEKRVEDWWARYRRDQCKAQGKPEDCLAKPLGHTQVPLIGEELQIRKWETNLGNWLADQALAAFREQGAQIAFLNAGGLRLNQNLPAGTALTQTHLAQLLPYPTPLGLIRIRGRTLQQIVDHAVQDWTGNGWWLQIAGFAFRQDPEEERAYDLTLLTPEGPRPVRPDEMILAVTNGFLLNPARGQDGYVMLNRAQVLVPPDQGPALKTLVIQALRAAEPQGIAPQVEGRICNVQAPHRPCLAVSP